MDLTKNRIETGAPRLEDARIDFLCETGEAIACFGERTGRIEDRLSACAATLQVDAQFYMLSTALFASFGRGARASTTIINTERGAVDLRRLMAVGDVLDAVTRGERTAEYGLALVRLIKASPPHRHWVWRALAAGCAGSSIAVVFGGGLPALLATLVVGTAVGVLFEVGARLSASSSSSSCSPPFWRSCSRSAFGTSGRASRWGL